MEHLEEASANSDALFNDVKKLDGWELHDEVDGVTIRRKTLPPEKDTEICMRGSAIVTGSVMQIADKLWNHDLRGEWDRAFPKEHTCVVEDSPIVRLTHTQFDVGIPFTDDRDLALVEHMRLTQSRGVYTYCSVSDEQLPKPLEDVVRCKAYPSGVVVTATPESSPPCCTVTYQIHLDFKGTLPEWFMTRFCVNTLEQITRLGDPLPDKVIMNVDEEEKEEEEAGLIGGFLGAVASFNPFGDDEEEKKRQEEEQKKKDAEERKAAAEAAKAELASGNAEGGGQKPDPPPASEDKAPSDKPDPPKKDDTPPAADKPAPTEAGASPPPAPKADAPAPKADAPPPAADAPPPPAPKADAPPPPAPKADAPPPPAPKADAPPPPAPKADAPPPPPAAAKPAAPPEDDDDFDDDNCAHCNKVIEGVKFQLLNDGRSVHDECWEDWKKANN